MFPHSAPALAHISDLNTFQAFLSAQLSQLKQYLVHLDRKSPRGLIHDLRVLSRRLRASLSVAESAAPSPGLKRLKKKIEKLTEILGPVRSLDVAVGDLKKRLPSASPSQAALLSWAVGPIRKRRQKWRRRLPKAVASAKIGKAVQRFEDPKFLGLPTDSRKIRDILNQEIQRACEKVQDDFRTFRKKGKMKDLHALRIELKKWRYLGEMEAKIFPSRESAERLVTGKEVQDRLGLIHDREALMEIMGIGPVRRRLKESGNRKRLKSFLKELKGEMKRESEEFRRQGEKIIMDLTRFAEANDSAPLQN